jgi:hypothetical protein
LGVAAEAGPAATTIGISSSSGAPTTAVNLLILIDLLLSLLTRVGGIVRR